MDDGVRSMEVAMEQHVRALQPDSHPLTPRRLPAVDVSLAWWLSRFGVSSRLDVVLDCEDWQEDRDEILVVSWRGDPTSAERLEQHRAQFNEPLAPRAFRLRQIVVGPALGAGLTALDLADEHASTLVEAVAGYERVMAWALAGQARVLRELSDRLGSSSAGLGEAASVVQARLAVTARASEAKLALAAGLDLFPEVADALAAGLLDHAKTKAFCERQSMSLPDQRRAQRAILPEAPRLTAPQIAARMRKAALLVNPGAAADARRRAFADRHVTITPAPDDMCWVTAFLRADQGQALRVALDAIADANVQAAASGTSTAPAASTSGTGSTSPTTDDRTRDQLRADALADLARTVLDRGFSPDDGRPLPKRQGFHPHLQVTVAAGTLLGLDDRPAELGGYGPISAELAREIAQDATWRALLTDANGQFVSLGTRTYRPGADLTRHVVARDVTCTFPGCRMPAHRADLDHIPGYDPALAATVVQTSPDRLHAVCRRHHRQKTAQLWTVVRREDGATEWRSRVGHVYAREPERPPGPSGDPWVERLAENEEPPPF